ncbi:MAG: hypothetical protein AAF436_07900 [Myxococcota bacterium]
MRYLRSAPHFVALLFVALVAGCSGSESGADSTLQCGCVRSSFVDGFLDRTLPDGTECDNSAIAGCQCLASRCQNFCAFDICQPECESSADCPENFECNELVDPEFGPLGQFCEFVEPCPEGTTGCPCGPNDECNAFGDRLEPFCDAEGICQVNDLCQAGCRQGSVCCGGALCSGDCIGTPCC